EYGPCAPGCQAAEHYRGHSRWQGVCEEHLHFVNVAGCLGKHSAGVLAVGGKGRLAFESLIHAVAQPCQGKESHPMSDILLQVTHYSLEQSKEYNQRHQHTPAKAG